MAAAKGLLKLRTVLVLLVLIGVGLIVYALVFNPIAADFNYNIGTSGTVQYGIAVTGNAAGGLSPYLYVWSFGDGAGASGQSVQHTYTVPGTYTVVLTVRDSLGGATSVSKTIQVPQTPPPTEAAVQPAAPYVVAPSTSMLVAGIVLLAFAAAAYAWQRQSLSKLWVIVGIVVLVIIAILYLITR